MASKGIMLRLMAIMYVDDKMTGKEVDRLARETLKQVIDDLTIDYQEIPAGNILPPNSLN